MVDGIAQSNCPKGGRRGLLYLLFPNRETSWRGGRAKQPCRQHCWVSFGKLLLAGIESLASSSEHNQRSIAMKSSTAVPAARPSHTARSPGLSSRFLGNATWGRRVPISSSLPDIPVSRARCASYHVFVSHRKAVQKLEKLDLLRNVLTFIPSLPPTVLLRKLTFRPSGNILNRLEIDMHGPCIGFLTRNNSACPSQRARCIQAHHHCYVMMFSHPRSSQPRLPLLNRTGPRSTARQQRLGPLPFSLAQTHPRTSSHPARPAPGTGHQS